MRGRRHHPSSIDRLDPEIRRLISDLRIEQGWTIDEIHQKLRELQQPVSRSALGRHTKSLAEIGSELRHSREMAKALVEAAPLGEDGKLAELNLELMHSMVLRIVTATKEGEQVTFGPKDLMFLSSALGNLASARKADADRRRKDREEAQKTVMKAVEKTATARGLTKETVDAIYSAVLGVQ
jgi:hypothetical protein